MSTETLLHHGEWYLPHDPSNRLAGVLDCTSNDPLLTMHGELPGHRPGSLINDVSGAWGYHVPILLGRVVAGPLITLEDCYAVSSVGEMTGSLALFRYRPLRTYLGAHFHKTDELAFRVATTELRNLRPWLGPPECLVRSGNRIEKSRLEPVTVTVGDATITTHVQLLESWRPYETTFRDVAAFEITSATPLPVARWHEVYLQPLRNLLTLATGSPSQHIRLNLAGDGANSVVQVIEAQGFGRAPTTRYRHAGEMLFAFADLRDCWGEVLRRWLGLNERASDALHLLFSVDYAPRMFVEHRFGNLVQALEVLHRRLRPEGSRQTESDRQRLATIITACPPEHVRWLQEKLAFSHEPSLRDRVFELVDQAGSVIAPFVADPRQFAKKVADTRNYLTHRNPNVRKKSASMTELWEYGFVLQIVLRVAVLHHIREDIEWAKRVVTGTQEYQFQVGRIRLGQGT